MMISETCKPQDFGAWAKLNEIDDPRCIRCGSHAVDTGWECDECGCDMGPILTMLAGYSSGIGKVQWSDAPLSAKELIQLRALQEIAWIIDGRADINDEGWPNIFMQIETVIKKSGALK